MPVQFMRAAVALAAILFCGTALAHPGHGNDAAAGLLHPLLGLDHLLAMLAVGMWSARLGGRAKWLVPASFIACMLLAAGLAMAGLALPMMETGIAASVLLSGLLLVFSIRVRPLAGVFMVALFALFHGYAHGLEMPAQISPWLYAAGFALSTAALHGLGLLAGLQLRRRQWALPATGTAIAASGGWMLAALA